MIEKLSNKTNEYVFLNNQKNKMLSKLNKQKLKDLSNSKYELETTLNLLNSLKKSVIIDNKKFIENTVNSSLQVVFETNVRIEIRIEEPTNKRTKTKYDIVYFRDEIEIGTNSNIMQSDGGSLLRVISFIFRILINKLVGNNIIFIDEELSQLSKDYLSKMSLLIKQIAFEFKTTIVVTTHTIQLADYANSIYRLSKTEKSTNGKLVIDKHEFLDNSNLEIFPKYNLKIKNFQSIEDVEFEYQGFVCVVGSGMIGKSAVFRAFGSLVYGDFKQSFVRYSTNKTTCELHYNGNSAKLESINGKIKYTLNSDVYWGIKNAKTALVDFFDIVFGIHYMDTSNFNSTNQTKKMLDKIICGSQFDSTLLVGSTSGHLDSTLESLFQTSTIIQAIGTCTHDLDKVSLNLSKLNNSTLTMYQTNVSEQYSILEFVRDNIAHLFEKPKDISKPKRCVKYDDNIAQLDTNIINLKMLMLFMELLESTEIELNKPIDGTKDTDNELNKTVEDINTIELIKMYSEIVNTIKNTDNSKPIMKGDYDESLKIITEKLSAVDQLSMLMTIHNITLNKPSEVKLLEITKELESFDVSHKGTCPVCSGLGELYG